MEDLVSISHFSVVRSISTGVSDPILECGVIVGEIIDRNKANNYISVLELVRQLFVNQPILQWSQVSGGREVYRFDTRRLFKPAGQAVCVRHAEAFDEGVSEKYCASL